MNLLKYFFSIYFFRQFFTACLTTTFLVLFVFVFLNLSTNHNRYILVPDLVGKNLIEINEILNENKLNFEITDSTFYNPDFPKYTVLSHFPTANSKVKKNRKIYLTVNPTNFRKVAIPNIIQITKRSAISSLLSTDLEIGEILYENNIGKDMVIQILFNDDEVEPGLLVPKKSRIDLVLGNGIAPNDE